MICLEQKHILVIAGPSACGKSTLIEEMLKYCTVADQIFAIVAWINLCHFGKLNLQRLVNSERLSIKSRKNQVELVLVQFDTLSRHVKARMLDFEQVLGSAKNVRVLILYLPFQEWLKRMNVRTGHPTSLMRSPWLPSLAFWVLVPMAGVHPFRLGLC